MGRSGDSYLEECQNDPGYQRDMEQLYAEAEDQRRLMLEDQCRDMAEFIARLNITGNNDFAQSWAFNLLFDTYEPWRDTICQKNGE